MSETIHARPAKPTPRTLRTTHCRSPKQRPAKALQRYPRLYRCRIHSQRPRKTRIGTSRILTPVISRYKSGPRELQHIAAKNAAETVEKMARELNDIQYEARADKAHAAAVAAVLGKAKILGIVDKPQQDRIDFNTTNSMQDIGRKLLQSVGFASPDDVSIQAAIEANDVFIARLEAIRDRAQTLTIE